MTVPARRPADGRTCPRAVIFGRRAEQLIVERGQLRGQGQEGVRQRGRDQGQEGVRQPGGGGRGGQNRRLFDPDGGSLAQGVPSGRRPGLG